MRVASIELGANLDVVFAALEVQVSDLKVSRKLEHAGWTYTVALNNTNNVLAGAVCEGDVSVSILVR